MSSTYSNSLRIELIGSGDQAGTWGTTTDNNFAYIFDSAIAGINTVAISSTSQALTYVNGPTSSTALNQSVYAILKFTGASAATAIYAPPAPKTYIIWNASGYAITIYNSTVIGNTTPAGTGITIANGDKIIVWSDGTNFYDVKSNTVTGTVAIANGGTGQTTQQAAINALVGTQTANRVLRSDGTNSTLAQVALTTDVTGALPVANGGTAATTAATARTNLGLAIGTDVPSPTGTGASGTWGINVSGNAATSTNTTGNAATVTNGVYTVGTQTIGGSKTFSSTILLADGGVMFASDGGQDTGFSWASDGVINVRSNNATVGQFNSSGFTGNAATATNPQGGGSFITSSNIAGQSVSFATNATNATNATTATNATNATTAASCSGNSATATSSTRITNSGGWSVTPSGTKLYFNYNGTNVGSLDSSGNFIALLNVTAYGTP